jgi:hypothetical protein
MFSHMCLDLSFITPDVLLCHALVLVDVRDKAESLSFSLHGLQAILQSLNLDLRHACCSPSVRQSAHEEYQNDARFEVIS